METPYAEPVVTDEDVEKRIEELRENKATYANEDPRPLAAGDFAVVSLESLSGADEPIKSDEVQVEIGGKETMPGFNENLTGATPGDEKEFDVTYPDDHGRAQLAGKTILFRVAGEGDSPQGEAGAERRIRAGPGRFPDRGRTGRKPCGNRLWVSAWWTRSARRRTGL